MTTPARDGRALFRGVAKKKLSGVGLHRESKKFEWSLLHCFYHNHFQNCNGERVADLHAIAHTVFSRCCSLSGLS